MRLPDFLIDEPLNQLRRAMGAENLGQLSLTTNAKRLTVAELEVLIGGGIDIASLDEVRSLDDGTLAYKDRRVFLYIRDVSNYGRGGSAVEDLPKFHISNCKKLQDMRAQRRFARYVVAAREDGQFQINKKDSPRAIRTTIEKLHVCQYCVGYLSFDGFTHSWARERRSEFVRRFTLSKFFDRYPRDLIDSDGLGDESTAPVNDYTGDFGAHADAAKLRANFRCQNCGFDLRGKELRRYLHAHHLNGVKYDNSSGNLRALCIRCHAEQPMHSHMKQLPEYLRFVQMFPI